MASPVGGAVTVLGEKNPERALGKTAVGNTVITRGHLSGSRIGVRHITTYNDSPCNDAAISETDAPLVIRGLLVISGPLVIRAPLVISGGLMSLSLLIVAPL